MRPCLKRSIACLLIFSFLLNFNFAFFKKQEAFAARNWAQTTVEVIMVCGDGMLDLGEACDRGNASEGKPPVFGGATCQTYGYEEGNLICANDCMSIITSNCNTCGNDIKEGREDCDISDYGASSSCQSLGYVGGNLYCTVNCLLNINDCQSIPLDENENIGSTGGGSSGGGRFPPGVAGSSGGGGSGNLPGAGQESPLGQTRLVVKGKAYPSSEVNILKDGAAFNQVTAKDTADFEFSTTDISAGVYTFEVWAKNKEGIKSTSYTITFRVMGGAVTTISGVYLAPSLSVDRDKVKQGEEIKFMGQTVPNADVYISVHSNGEVIKQTTSDNIGVYLLPFNTAQIENEQFHIAKSLFQAQESGNTIRSGYSQSVSFYVGAAGGKGKCAGADLNGDNRVNLVDFSILLYNWGSASDCADQNKDGKINLTDFSIMMYYWTG